MEDINVNVKIPKKIFDFINEKIEEGYFKSIEDFILHGVRLLSEFYGLPGESTLDKILKNLKITPAAKTKPGLTENEQFLLDAIGKSKFVFEDEVYALILKEAMVRGVQPMSRDEYKEALESLINKGLLERLKHGSETIIKKKEE